MKDMSRGMSLVLAALCLAASPATGAPKKACTVGAAEAKAEAARFPHSNYTTIAWCPEAVPILIGMLEDEDLRQGAAAALRDATTNTATGTWRYDEVQAAAVPHLAAIAAATKRLAESKGSMADWGVADMLQDVMGGMGKAAVPHLADGLQKASAGVRYSAATNLRKMGVKAAAALPALRAALKNEKDATTAGEIRAAIKAIEGK